MKVRNSLFLFLIFLSMQIPLSQKSYGAAGLAIGLLGDPLSGTRVAVAGLAIVVGGSFTLTALRRGQTQQKFKKLEALLLPICFILLSENHQGQLKLQNLTQDSLTQYGLSPKEQLAVLENKEELEALFTEAMADRHINLAESRFSKAKEILGDDSLNGLYKILTAYL